MNLDSDWARDESNRRSIIGFIIYLGQIPITWYSNTQTMIENSSYSSIFIVLNTAPEHIGSCNSLRFLGIEVRSPTLIRCRDRIIVSNNVQADSTLRNRAIGIAYHLHRK